MTRIYFHGNCQTRAMSRMMREMGPDIEVRGREVHKISLPDELPAFHEDIDWADVIVTQPISETYRDEPELSTARVRARKRPGTRIAVFPSLFFRVYTPQIHYLPRVEAVGMPYHDACLLRGYTLGRSSDAVAAELDDPDFMAAELIERELAAALRQLRQREDQACDVRASDILEAGCRDTLLFHTPNHPGREVLWRVLDRVLEHVGIAVRPDREGTDYLRDLTIPPPPSVVAALRLRAGPEVADLQGFTRYRLPGRPQTVCRRDYAAELWGHYAAIGGPSILGARLAEEPGLAGFLRRHDEARRRVTKSKRNFGPPTKFVELPRVSGEREWRGADEASWINIPAKTRLAPAPIVDRNADLVFFLTRTHHKHQVGLWSYPSGTVSRGRDLSVSYLERAEGGVLGARGFYASTQWLDQVPSPPPDLIQKIGRDIHVQADALIRPPARPGEFVLCFDGNWRNYYHWLIDCVSRLFVLRTVSDGRILMPAPPEQLLRFHLDSLICLGVSEDQLVWPEPGRLFEKCQSLVWMNWNPTPWGGIGMLGELGAAYRAAVGLGEGPGHRRLYVTRGSGRRMVRQGREIEDLMRRLGFEIVVPDQLSFAEQARLFGEAARVVGPHGAGMANILFAPPGCTVVEFMPDVLCRPHYWGMATSLGHRYGVMVVPGKSFFDDLDVDPARLEAFVTALSAAPPSGEARP